MKKISYIVIALFVLQTAAQAQLTYKDVAPIFIQRCTSCHHQGKIFPYFSNYSSTSGYRGLISNDLQTGKMPPWSPDTTYSRFTHERIITQSEKAKIVNWIAAGAPAGDTSLAAVVPHYPATQLNGTPDLVLSIPPYLNTASSSDKYMCFSLPTGLTQDRVLRAYELVTGNGHMVHHIVITLDTLGTSVTDVSGTCTGFSGGFNLGGYAPGSAPTVFPGVSPAKFGITIKAGSKIGLQMHYPAGTAGQIDSTQIRLFFYPLNTTGIRRMNVATPLKNSNFKILANAIDTVTAVYPRTGGIPADISAYAIFPHSHKICTGIVNYATDGITMIPLCGINKWIFEWQGFYTFQSLVRIPAGYKLYGKHIFNNTVSNPYHVPTTVYAGLAATDEMVFDGLMWVGYQPGDENIDIRSIIEADSLFRLPDEKIIIPDDNINIGVYPNPFTDKLTIAYELFSDDEVSLCIYNMLGQKIIDLSGSEPAGYHRYEWHGTGQGGSPVSPGIYTYKLKVGTTQQCGKIMFSPKD